MSRINCISNRNIRIIASYVKSKLGHHDSLFLDLPYPSDRFPTPEAFFLNEDEWTTYNNFLKIFRKGKKMVGETYFFFHCGASSATLHSWGRLQYFARIFTSPSDGMKRLPFFNRHFNDTKEIELVIPPFFDKSCGKMKALLRITFHEDMDVHQDYIGDPYLRGILCAIPTLWGLGLATVRQPLNPYDPESLFNHEPEYTRYGLDARMEDSRLTVVDPHSGHRKVVGRKVLLEPERINGRDIYLGKYRELPKGPYTKTEDSKEAILIQDTLEWDNRILLKAGEFFKAPYFILEVTYDRTSLPDRLAHVFRLSRHSRESGEGLMETIEKLKESMEARNRAYRELQDTNRELHRAKLKLEDYAKNLEDKVLQRTADLRATKEKLARFNRELESRVKEQVEELKRYNELRRYLSPRLTEKILDSGEPLDPEPKRKMMTVMFSDIRSFSSLTDSLEPEEIFPLLDSYITEMTHLIHHYEGTLNKIIGDGLLIFFGDPVPMEDHAQRAVLMAVDMQKKVAALKGDWRMYGYELGIGIGINTGYMTVGSIGSELHRDYTVIGNQVNVAARLESLAKSGQILISQRTYGRVKDLLEAEKMGEIKVKGIHSPIETFNVRVA